MIARDDIIYGRNPVTEAIRAGREINRILIANDQKDSIFRLAMDKGITIINTDRRKLDKIAGNQNHQGVVAFVSPYAYHEIDDMLDNAKQKNEQPFIILLDDLTDDNNFANIIRSADAFGAHGIIIPKRNSVSVNAIVAKRSAGAIEHMLIARVTNLSRTIDELKEKGIWVYCADMDSGNMVSSTDLNNPVALVIGNEGYGVSRLVKQKSDFVISIPTAGHVESLNAANAAAVISYEIFRQRRTGGHL